LKWKLARDALIVTIFVLFGVWFAFGQDRFDFAGATNCSCKIEHVVDILGNLKPNIHLILGMHAAVALLLPENHPTRIKNGPLKNTTLLWRRK